MQRHHGSDRTGLIAGYSIDLVVEGMQGRLAVECDGDKWHGAERYEQDMARQRMLERCGWIFWRVRGSTFYIDPDHAMNGLWKVLEDLNIKPDVTIDPTPKEEPDPGKNENPKPPSEENFSDNRKEPIEPKATPKPSPDKGTSKEDRKLIEWVYSIPSKTWRLIADWAEENRKLPNFERNFARGMSHLKIKNRYASVEQAKIAQMIYKKAEELGFKK